MVIKVRSIINKCISISVCILLCFSAYKKYAKDTILYDSLLVHIDSSLAAGTGENLSTFLRTHVHSLNDATFFSHLVAEFPCIKSYTLEKNASGFMVCSAQTACPVLRINNQWVVTETGSLALQESFEPIVLENLHRVAMPEWAITTAFLETMQKFPSELFNNYDVIWLSDQEALLRDRSQPNFIIKYNAHVMPTDTIVRHCNMIKHDLQDKMAFDSIPGKKKPQQWIADIRFKNQIVMSQNVGGMSYG